MKRPSWLTLLLLLPLFLFTAQCSRKPSEPDRPKIYLLGLDGLSWEMLDPLIAKGELPLFARLKREGSWGRLKTFKPTLSAVVWTSIATGRSMVEHGIVDWTYVASKGLHLPYTASERRVPALWEFFNLYGRSSTVLHWFVSYPPDPVAGRIVSDSFPPALVTILGGARPSRFVSTVHPQSEYWPLVRRAEELKKSGEWEYGKMSTRANLPDYYELYRKTMGKDPAQAPVLKGWPQFLLYERLLDEEVDLYLPKNKDDLFFVYSHLPDTFLHFGTYYLEKEYRNYVEETVMAKPIPSREEGREFDRRMADLLLPVLKYREATLAKILARVEEENAYLVVVSDHGFALSPRGYTHQNLPEEMDPPSGMVLLFGPGIRKGQEIQNGSVLDVAPTILTMAGLPVDRKMEGKVWLQAFVKPPEMKFRSYPPRKKGAAGKAEDLDKKRIEDLKSLGYL